MSYVYNALRGNALLWYEALTRYGVDDKDWDVLKRELLDAYSKVQTTQTAVIGLNNLSQGNDETVIDFGARVAKVVNDLDKLMPAAARQPQGIQWPAAVLALAGFNNLPDATKQQPLNAAADKAIWNSMNHMGVQLFISNLKASLREELMKAPPATLMEAVKTACHLEMITTEPKSSNGKATAVSAVAATDDAQADIKALSTSFKSWLAKQGRGNSRNRGRGPHGARGGRGASNGTAATCRYCKKPGHMQKYCNSRIGAGAPEVDDKGKPCAKYLNELEEGDEDEQQQQQHEQGSISASFNPWTTQPQQLWEQDFY